MKKFNQEFKVGNKTIGGNNPTYFIADIAANHDGSLERAKELIFLAKESGADCAKFQHFSAKKIVSDYGFKDPKIGKISHQASWNKSVYDIYDQYHTRTEWTEELVTTCKEADIEFLPMQPGDVKETYADVTETTELTGYKPTTPISVGVPRFIDWFKSYYKI